MFAFFPVLGIFYYHIARKNKDKNKYCFYQNVFITLALVTNLILVFIVTQFMPVDMDLLIDILVLSVAGLYIILWIWGFIAFSMNRSFVFPFFKEFFNYIS
jgi:uncharacterized membrane-anchored protein